MSYTAVNSRVTERVNSILSRMTAGHASRGEISYQANYGIAIATGLSIKPFFEFISHPDQASIAKPTANDTHAVLVGTLFEIDPAAFLGLPALVNKAVTP